jgi:vacuolar-type H+-ATPase subunit F/Vma7
MAGSGSPDFVEGEAMARREIGEWDALWHEAAQVFSPGAPIDESALFAGRVDQLRDLINAVNQRGQHAIVFGERGVGKTSLANIFTNYIHRPVSHILATRINCDGVASFQNLWRKVFDELEIAAQLDNNIGPDDIRRILSAVSKNTIPIIVFDEFDRLGPGRTTGLLADTIKGLSDHSVSATIVIVGVANSVADLLREHASIGRALVEIPMPRMSDDEIKELIEKRVRRLGMSMGEDTLEKIVMYTQGLPHYAHLMGLYSCQEAIVMHTKSVDQLHLDAAIGKCIAKVQQSIRDAYHRATSSPRPDNLFKEVLLACSLAQTDELGFFSASDVVEPMSSIMEARYNIPSFARHLKEFCSDDRGRLLERRGVKRKYRYRFRDPLMQPFVTLQAVSSGLMPKDYQ